MTAHALLAIKRMPHPAHAAYALATSAYGNEPDQ